MQFTLLHFRIFKSFASALSIQGELGLPHHGEGRKERKEWKIPFSSAQPTQKEG